MSTSESIKVPTLLATAVVMAGMAWLGWMSYEIIGLKSDMSAVKEHLQINVAHTDENVLARQ